MTAAPRHVTPPLSRPRGCSGHERFYIDAWEKPRGSCASFIPLAHARGAPRRPWCFARARVFVVVQSRPMKRSCPSKGACFSKAHSNIHETSCVSKFCLGRRIKQPEVDKLLSVAHVIKLLSPYGKFHRSTNCKILWRQQDHNPFQD